MTGFEGRRGGRRVAAGGAGEFQPQTFPLLGSARDTGSVLSNLDFVLNF